MNFIGSMREKIRAGKFEFSKHATDQSIKRNIHVQEMKEALLNGEVIEDYPDDKYGPSCLIFGLTTEGHPLHVQCSYPQRDLIKIITLYRPDSDRWINFKRRK